MEFANIRPLGVGEVLDTAFRVYRTRFKDLLIAVAIPLVPLIALQILVNLSVSSETRLETQNGVLVRTTGPSTGVALGVTAVTILISILASAIAQGSSIRIISDQYLGSTTTWSDSLRFALERLGSIIWVSLLAGISAILGLVLCVLPGVYLWVAFSVSVPALLIENDKGTKALSRSRVLVRGRWWPTFGTFVVVYLLQFVISAGLSIVVGGGTIASGRITGATSARILSGLVTGGITVMMTPLLAAVATIIYFDLRVRKEGFDVALMAQRLGVPPPPAGTGTAPTTAPPATPPSWQMPPAEPGAGPAVPPPTAPGTPPRPVPGSWPPAGGSSPPASPWGQPGDPPAPEPPPPDA
ncbi:MAG: hypothetical protein ACXVJX_18790 [Acidimicrobiia bacterium]